MSLTHRVASNVLIQVLGKGLTTAIGLVIVGLLTRHLGVAGYGDFTTIFAYVAFFAVLADMGFYVVLLRELSQPKADEARLLGNGLVLQTLLAAGVFLVGFLIATVIPQYSVTLAAGIGILSLGSLLLVGNQLLVGVFQRYLRMGRAVGSELVGRVVILLGLLWLIADGAGILTILWVYVLGNAANLVVSWLLARPFVRIQFQIDLALWQRLTLEALPMGIVLLLHVIYFKIDTVMLSLMQSSTDVGIYGAPFKILEVLILFPVILLGNLFPTFTRYLAEGNRRFALLYQQGFEVLMVVAIPMVLVTLVLAEPILTLVAGSEYVTASTVTWLGSPATGTTALQLLIVAVGLTFVSQLPSYLLVASGRQRQLVGPNLLFVLLNVGLNLLLIPVLSYVGASLATIVTELVVCTVLVTLVARHLDCRLALRPLVPIFLASLVSLGIAWLLREANLAVALLASLTCYGLALWRLKGIPAPLGRLLP